MRSEGGGAEGASNSISFTGTKAGAIVSSDAATPGFSFAGPCRRSRQSSRERRIHLKTRLAFNPCRRATAATEVPGATAILDDPFALVEASRSPPLPSSALRRHLVSTSDPGGHLIQSRCFATGGRQVTLTVQ